MEPTRNARGSDLDHAEAKRCSAYASTAIIRSGRGRRRKPMLSHDMNWGLSPLQRAPQTTMPG